ncbi:DUF5687 family protein [Flavobacterium sp. GT3R68]|uniref:DUF5687 family protein n=1 Tax=Flavobacterium sp. GT3R68 TaxID=2594437 RepID=UPI000F86DD6A|nr:DUF5687 family protein [Flavobacterium sp. GT3R68]RTY95934.1 hypothetical protein EKL32_04620 [Flavobacterium sp. GSN2]TRW93706.1 hypothetical protein FNW07_02010 [Flavobacterium sp. GT3R68]
MFKLFLKLEWKAFLRSASFGTNLALKILMAFGAIYLIMVFLLIGIGGFYMLQDMKIDPLITVNKYLIYYFVMDLTVRLLLQKIPVMNIRPLLVLPINRNTIVNFSLGKTMLSFFNLIHLFYFVPFTIILLMEGYDVLSVLTWFISILSLIYINNFLNVVLNNKDSLLIVFLTIMGALGVSQYYGLLDITNYTSLFFDGMFATLWVFLIPMLTVIALYLRTFIYLKKNLYLDAGLASKGNTAKTENFTWLNQFGTLGTFLKNDIKLIKRNKRSKTTVFMSFLFLFYGLLFFTRSIEVYDNPVMKMFGGIFVSGGFLFTFGQFVPSWDSSYYQLMMTQNISYRDYLNSKWWLIVIATVITTVLASFYLYFGWEAYMMIIVGAVYNIGVNSYLVLLGGAYIKTPVDLSSSKGAFGDKKAFNVKTMLISLPKIFLPIMLYGFGYFLISPMAGLALVAITGILGFALRNSVFGLIEKIYKIEKYKTLDAYKQKN